MSEKLIELKLEDSEVELLALNAGLVKESSRIGAQKAYDFARLLTDLVQAMNKGDDAQSEYLRVIKRIAKARSRQPDDVADVNLEARPIVFKKNKRDLAKEQDDDEPEGQGE